VRLAWPGQGMSHPAGFRRLLLLRDRSLLSATPAAVVRKVRTHPQELGCKSVRTKLLAGDLDYQDFIRAATRDEAVGVAHATGRHFTSRAWVPTSVLRRLCDAYVSELLSAASGRSNPTHPNVTGDVSLRWPSG
jgi:hypothetical protein